MRVKATRPLAMTRSLILVDNADCPLARRFGREVRRLSRSEYRKARLR